MISNTNNNNNIVYCSNSSKRLNHNIENIPIIAHRILITYHLILIIKKSDTIKHNYQNNKKIVAVIMSLEVLKFSHNMVMDRN